MKNKYKKKRTEQVEYTGIQTLPIILKSWWTPKMLSMIINNLQEQEAELMIRPAIWYFLNLKLHGMYIELDAKNGFTFAGV